MVECLLPKQKVGGSNPLARSNELVPINNPMKKPQIPHDDLALTVATEALQAGLKEAQDSLAWGFAKLTEEKGVESPDLQDASHITVYGIQLRLAHRDSSIDIAAMPL